MIELFCKTNFDELMPAIRAMVAVRLLNKGFSQLVVSKKLGLTQPAISQYKSKLRGVLMGKMESNKSIVTYVDHLVDEIVKENFNLNTRACEMCGVVRKAQVLPENNKEFLCLLEIAREKRN